MTYRSKPEWTGGAICGTITPPPPDVELVAPRADVLRPVLMALAIGAIVVLPSFLLLSRVFTASQVNND